MKINKQSRRIKKKTVVALSIVVALLIGYVVFAKVNNTWPFSDESNDSSTREVNSVNYDPPTEQEVKDSQDAKNRILEESSDPEDSPESDPNTASSSGNSESSKKPVAVSISYADIYEGNLEIRAFTPSVVEGSGKCTATVSKAGSQNITKESSAFVDVASTICEPIYIPRSDLSPGTWNISVNYSSPNHKGSSGSVKVEVN